MFECSGYGDKIDNTKSISHIKQNLLDRHKKWKMLRPQLMTGQEYLDADERIHVIFYFISPHRMRDIDNEFINNIAAIAPIVPIISKADAMTTHERNTFLHQVKTRIDYITNQRGFDCIHNFHNDDIPKESNVLLAKGLESVPNIFTVIIRPEYEQTVHNKTVNAEPYSDFRRLQMLLFENGNGIKSLLDSTRLKSMNIEKHMRDVSPIHFHPATAAINRPRSNTMQIGKLQMQHISMSQRSRDNTPLRSSRFGMSQCAEDDSERFSYNAIVNENIPAENCHDNVCYPFVDNPRSSSPSPSPTNRQHLGHLVINVPAPSCPPAAPTGTGTGTRSASPTGRSVSDYMEATLKVLSRASPKRYIKEKLKRNINDSNSPTLASAKVGGLGEIYCNEPSTN